MALRVWLPLNGNLNNQGLSSAKVEAVTTASFSDGKIGQSLSGGKIKIPAEYIGDIFNNEHMSICFWYYTNTDATSGNHSICGFSGNGEGDSGAVRSWDFFAYSVPTTFHWSMGTIGGGSLANILPNNQWVHIAVTFDGSKLLIYFNGELQYTGSGSSNFTFDKSYYISFGSTLQKLNDFRIYDECLSPKQIKEISKGLVAHYKLDYPDIEPTMNLTYGNNYVPAVNTGWGAHRATSTDENLYKTYLPFETGTKVVYAYDTSLGTGGGAGIQNKIRRIAIKPSTQYFYSLYVKPGDDFTYFNENFLYRYEYDSSNTKLTEGGVAKKANLIELEDGWYRIWGTFTTKENTSLAEFWFYSYPSKNITYYIGGCQVEEKDHMTPFVAGERNYYPSDCSGNEYNLTMTGNLTYNEDSPRYEGSTTFDGDNLNYFYRNAFDFLTDSLTYNCWVYQTSKTTTSSGATSLLQMIMSQGRDYGNASYGMNIDSYNGIPEVRIGKYGVQNIVIAGTTQLVNEQWHMLTATWDGTTAKLYVDGTLEKTGTVSEVEYTQNSNSFIIGKMAYLHTNPTSYFPFVGSISDVRLYATALSAEDILTMYKTSGIIDNKGNTYSYELNENNINLLEVKPAIFVSADSGAEVIYPLDNDYRKSRITDGISGGQPGLKFNNADLPIDTSYKLSFCFKKISGTLNTIGGHCSAFTNQGVYIDGRKVSDYFASPTVAEQKDLINDGEIHYLETFLTKTDTAGDANLYIQINRNYGHVSGTTIELYNIKLEKYENEENAKITKNGELKGYFEEKNLNNINSSLSNKNLWASNSFIEI